MQWTVRADRRAGRWREVQADLVELAAGVDGLEVALEDAAEIEARADIGAFRDFVPVAVLRAPDARILERIGEELIAEFGFTVDWKVLPDA